jgi:hypothetical protein
MPNEDFVERLRALLDPDGGSASSTETSEITLEEKRYPHEDFWREEEFGGFDVACFQCYQNEHGNGIVPSDAKKKPVHLRRRHCRDGHAYYVFDCDVCKETVVYMTVSPAANNMFRLRQIEIENYGRTVIELDHEAMLDEIMTRAHVGPVELKDIISIVNGNDDEKKTPSDRWGLI